MSEEAKGDPGTTDFSVVIPTYNRAGHIAPCLAPFLEPEARGIEVILVDDGSTDDSAAVAQRVAASSRGAEIRYFRTENRGAAAARNEGLRQASAEWICFLDIDDRWFPWSLRHMRSALALADAEEAGFVFSQMLTFETEEQLAEAVETEFRPETARNFFVAYIEQRLPLFGTCNCSVRASIARAGGGFDEDFEVSEDVEFFVRCGGNVRVILAKGLPLIAYRTNSGDSLVGNLEKACRGNIQLLKKYMNTGPDSIDLSIVMANQCIAWHRTFMKVGRSDLAFKILLSGRSYVFRTRGSLRFLKLLAWTVREMK